MEPLGLELKRAREARSISLRDMAARTKISTNALESLERNDFSRLPGGIFGRAFVRAYAVEVGLDPEGVVTRFTALLEQAEQEAAERRAATQPEITLDDRQFLERQQRALMALRVVLVVVALAVVVVGGWQVRAFMQRRRAAAAPAPVAAPVTVPAPAPERTPAAAQTPSADATGTPTDTLATASGAAPSMTTGTAPATVTPAAGLVQGAGAPTAAATSAIVADFEFTGECWLSVAVDGRAPVSRMFQAGERQRVQADSEILIDAGNAGVVRLTLNGKAARPLGRDGTHERTRVTRDNLAAFLN